ncbi:Aste57867_9482 [Aphanomyces stellatus]|uniref:Aste57867_9482 protein n=1 Tax=Aphanomyces stellatus TaxID=120398 RepID=A0A485KN42_9STRA|nr:hypothetical protein As57867_009445 [Aphanomyces stellatus]VFT86361.1 Aste57867_9482 [Aphanomyces stellatus]
MLHLLGEDKPHRMYADNSSDDDSAELCALAKDVLDLQACLMNLSRCPASRKRRWCEKQAGSHYDSKRMKTSGATEHAHLFAQLQCLVQSTPCVLVEDWVLNMLPQEKATWTRGIHSMLARDYDRLSTVFVRNGLYDPTASLCKTTVRRSESGAVTSIDKVAYLRLAAGAFDDVAKVSAALLMTPKGRACLVQGTKWDPPALLEHVDEHTLYLQCHAKVDAGAIPSLAGRVAIQRFVEPTRVVFVLRSVRSDARFPIEKGAAAFAHDEVGWFVVEKHGDVCEIKSVVSCTPSAPCDKSLRSCVNMYRQPNRSMTELVLHALAARCRRDQPSPPSNEMEGAKDVSTTL